MAQQHLDKDITKWSHNDLSNWICNSVPYMNDDENMGDVGVDIIMPLLCLGAGKETTDMPNSRNSSSFIFIAVRRPRGIFNFVERSSNGRDNIYNTDFPSIT